jgi:uncharacterized protein YjbI with pentapeptide repeats
VSEFNELVKAYLLGNNIYFEESEKEPGTLVLSEIGKKQGFMPKLFEKLKIQKESLKIFIMDNPADNIELNDEADIVIWNDSFSGKNLEERIKQKLRQKTSIQLDGRIGEVDSRYLGMGRDILYAKFFGQKRVEDLLEVGKVTVTASGEEKSFFSADILGEKRFAFILEELDETQYLKREFNRFMDFFCREEGVMGQSLPIYFESIDFWFGGMLHSQLTNRLNQDLGLFFTEDTVFYMVRLGYIIPFINEMDLFCSEGYLNPQASHIAHLFHLCGERGMFMAGCSWDSILYEDVREGVEFGKLKIEDDIQWLRTIAKPMGSRILEDEVNAELFGVESGYAKQSKVDGIVQQNEKKLMSWIEDPDFPILKPGDRMVLMKQVAVKWMEKGSYYLELDEFHGILFASDILPEGKRTLAHVHEIVRAVMNSNILSLSDYNQVIPVSRLMGEAITLWTLVEEYNNKKSLGFWLDQPGFSQMLFKKLLKRFAADENKNILTPLLTGTLDIINNESNSSLNVSQKVIENALELYIAINNSGHAKDFRPITGQRLYDMNMSHEIINGLKFQRADMHNILFQQSIFIDCDFRECNLASSYFAGSTFLNCRFEQTNLRNADFSGSYFRGCVLEGNVYEDLILVGCAFENDCEMDLDISRESGDRGLRIWNDGSTGIRGQEKEKTYDLPVLIYLLQKEHKFYSRYGFKINPDVGFHHFENQLGTLSNEKFLEQYNYYDVYDEINRRPELFFAKAGSIHYVREGVKKDYGDFTGQGIYIDHVIKHKANDQNGTEAMRTKILFHTTNDTFIEENPDREQWFKSSHSISDKFVGRGVSGIFLASDRILAATDVGGLFLFEKKDGDWLNIDSKFQSEPVSLIFPDCFENMAFVKRGSSVVEIWDTLNDLSLLGRLVTSFKEVLGIRLIENLNHAVIYGEWIDGTIGALAYNIINKHLITYWNVLSEKDLNDFSNEDFKNLEKMYLQEATKLLSTMKEKTERRVSLEDGFIKRGCKELRQIMDAMEIISPKNLTYMEGEPVEFEWKIKSKDPAGFPVNKVYTDIITGEKVDFEFEIKIGDILSVQSGKLKIEYQEGKLSAIWKEDCFEIPKGTIWGDYKLSFGISLLDEEKRQESIFKIRPQNPFRGGKSLSRETGSDYLFIGREEELKTALELIKEGESFTIKGARRIGKTSFMHRLRVNLPTNVLAAYISFEEFAINPSQSALLMKTQDSLTRLMERYPNVYNEFRKDFEVLRDVKPSLDFEWLMSMGIEKLKKEYSNLLSEIWPELEKKREPGRSPRIFFDKLIQYLKTFDEPMKVVFIVDEIGIAKDKGVKLREIFTAFRPIIDNDDIAIILAGIPYNFYELTRGADLVTDSGLISFLNKEIVLGPLTDEECKSLIRNHLSQRIKIADDVLNYALQLSARRPEDLQLIMHFALKDVGDNAVELNKQLLIIEECHIEKGFSELLELRGDNCFKIWEEISEGGKTYLKNKYKLNTNGKEARELLEAAFNEPDVKNISKEDIEIFKGYGFTNPDGKLLIIPVYFQEWVRQEFYKRQFQKEDYRHEN